MVGVRDWSTSASSNTTVSGVSIAENAPRANMNDMGRAIMANVRLTFGLYETAYSVLEEIPTNLHASIRDRTVNTNLKAYFDAAAIAAVAGNVALYIPPGTFTMTQWFPPAGITVLTGGKETVLKQMDSSGVPTRFIEVQADNISLWPGGACSIDGGMTAGGVNATSFNSGVRVHALDGVTINTFRCGDIHGSNIGGDVFETGAGTTGTLVHCEVGVLYASNVYRNVASITAGSTGSIAGLIHTGGVGYTTCSIEPDAASGSPIAGWNFGHIRGHRFKVSGATTSIIGGITVHHLDLDYTRTASNPIFNYGGVSLALTPNVFQRAIEYRNSKSIRFGHSKIKSFPQEAMRDIGEAGGDTPTEMVKFDYLEMDGCGASSDSNITTKKTELVEIGFIRDTAKVAAADSTFVVGESLTHIRVNAGFIDGKVTSSCAGSLELRQCEIDGDAQIAFSTVTGLITLDRCVITDTATLFNACTAVPEVRDSTITATTILDSGTTNAHYFRSTVNSVFYADQLATVINAQVGTTYTLVAADLGKLITCSNAGAITLTVPANATVAFPIGAEVRVMQGAAGAVTVATGGTPTLRSRGTLLTTNGQYAAIRLTKIATDEWLIDGDRV